MSRMRVQLKHWELLLNYLDVHPELITGKFSTVNSKQEQQKLWDEITCKLNALGGGEKTAQKWKDALIDWKYKTKKKASDIKNEMNKTGGGGEGKKLNEHEERLLSIIGWTCVEGDVGTVELGLQNPNNKHQNDTIVINSANNAKRVVTVLDEIPVIESSCENEVEPAIATAPKKRKTDIHKSNLSLSDNLYERHQEETMNVLRNINNNLEKTNDILSNLTNILNINLQNSTNAINNLAKTLESSTIFVNKD